MTAQINNDELFRFTSLLMKIKNKKIKNKKTKNKQSGFTLVEIMVALGLVTMISVGIMKAIQSGYKGQKSLTINRLTTIV